MTDSNSRLYTAAQVRALDKCAIEQHGIPGIGLMQSAGLVLWEAGKAAFPDCKRWLILCGAGNNGGDGYVVARLARDAGNEVLVCALRPVDSLCGDALTAARGWLESGGVVTTWPLSEDCEHDIIVDALLGTGLDGLVRGVFAEAINWINKAGLPVVSVDIPSGLNADTGMPMGSAVKANITATFVGQKRGLYTAEGPELSGQIVFSNLDIPRQVSDCINDSGIIIRESILTDHISPRRLNSHKGSFGHVLALGGHPGMSGAVRLCGEAALRSGAGKVTVITHSEHAAFINLHCPELMVREFNVKTRLESSSSQVNALVLGTGMGQSQWSEAIFRAGIEAGLPTVIDADGLNLLSRLQPVPASSKGRNHWILTPHPAEAGRLLGISTTEVQADRVEVALKVADRYQAITVLKGCGTVIASPTGQYAICTLGNPGMATAGTGDVLAGVIGAMIAQDFAAAGNQQDRLWTAALLGVAAHAAAGDLAASERGERGMLASDIISCLPSVLNPQ